MTAKALQTFARAHGAFLKRADALTLTIMQARILCELPATRQELIERGYNANTISEATAKLRTVCLIMPHAPSRSIRYERTAEGDALILGPLKTLNPSKA